MLLSHNSSSRNIDAGETWLENFFIHLRTGLERQCWAFQSVVCDCVHFDGGIFMYTYNTKHQNQQCTGFFFLFCFAFVVSISFFFVVCGCFLFFWGGGVGGLLLFYVVGGGALHIYKNRLAGGILHLLEGINMYSCNSCITEVKCVGI